MARFTPDVTFDPNSTATVKLGYDVDNVGAELEGFGIFASGDNWIMALDPLGHGQSTKFKVTGVQVLVKVSGNAVCQEVRFVIYKAHADSHGAQYTLGKTDQPATRVYDALVESLPTALDGSNDTTVNYSASNLSLDVDLPALTSNTDESYHWGLSIRWNAASNSLGQFQRRTNNLYPGSGIVVRGTGTDCSPLTMEDTVGTCAHINNLSCIVMEATTTCYTKTFDLDPVPETQNVAIASTKCRPIPRVTDEDYWLIFKDISFKEGDGDNKTRIQLRNNPGHDSVHGNLLAEIMIDKDYAANNSTLSVQDKNSTETVTLQTDDTENDDRWDIYVNIRPTTLKFDVFYVNTVHGEGIVWEEAGSGADDDDWLLTTFAARKCYETDPTDERTAIATYMSDLDALPTWVTLAGSEADSRYYAVRFGAQCNLQVSIQPIMLMGDSQCADYYVDGNSMKFGSYIGSKMTQPRAVLRGHRPGRRLGWEAGGLSCITNTFRAERGLDAADSGVGWGDWNEATNCIWMIKGGTNDLLWLSGWPDHDQDGGAIAQSLRKTAEWAAYVVNKGESCLILGMVPVRLSATTGVLDTEDEVSDVNMQIQRFNHGLAGLAASSGAAYYNPYDLILPDVDTLVNDDGYHEVGGTSGCPYTYAEYAAESLESNYGAPMYADSVELVEPVKYLTNVAPTTRGTMIRFYNSNSDATSTQWNFFDATGHNQPPNFTVTTTRSGSTSGNVLDSSLTFINIWLPPYHTYVVRARQLVNGSHTAWTDYF